MWYCNMDRKKMRGEIMAVGIKVALVYLILINIIAFALMGIDKRRAVQHKWRISEANLFLSALLGGSIGAIAGMQMFRHKTKHWYFVVGMPLILICQVVICWWIFWR